jgi:DNA-binding XRE family transcriptional regulator
MRTLAAILKNEIKRVAREEADRSLRRVRRLQRQTKALRQIVSRQRLVVERLDRRTRKLRAALLAARGLKPARQDAGTHFAPREIYELRSRLGLTRVQFAKRLGVSAGSIFGWEHGRTLPRGANVARLADLKRGTGSRPRAQKRTPKKKRAARRRRVARR